MKFLKFAIALTAFILMGCDQNREATVKQPAAANVLEIMASGLRFEGPETVPSGWTTIKLHNEDPMVHFGMVVKLPDGISAFDYSNKLGANFQKGYNLMVEGKDEDAAAVFGALPGWIMDLGHFGGPGFTGASKTSSATMFLEPGNYVIECYVKSNGFFHSYSPDETELAMVLPVTVTAEERGMAEPDANATITINDAGYTLTDGALKAGENTIRVIFETQAFYPTYVGKDIHIARLENGGDLAAAIAWMDWRNPEGLAVPAPVTFVGGLEDMPEGSTGYFTVDLTPGHYAFIAEVPDARQEGLVLEFDVE